MELKKVLIDSVTKRQTGNLFMGNNLQNEIKLMKKDTTPFKKAYENIGFDSDSVSEQ